MAGGGGRETCRGFTQGGLKFLTQGESHLDLHLFSLFFEKLNTRYSATFCLHRLYAKCDTFQLT